MSQNTLSRRNFMTGIAVGGTAATLASPAVAVAAEPVVTATYPLATPAASAGPIKMLCTHKVSAAEEQQIRSAGKNVDFVVVGSRAELPLPDEFSGVVESGEPGVRLAGICPRQ